MITLDEAVESGLFYTLEHPVRVLIPPIEVFALLREKRIRFVWELAVLTRRQLSRRGITKAKWPGVEDALRTHGLSFETELDFPLWALLCFGHFRFDDFDLDNAVCALMRYVQANEVSERTRYFAEWHRDAYAGRINAYRKRMAGIVNFPIGNDAFGLKQFHSMGIIALG